MKQLKNGSSGPVVQYAQLALTRAGMEPGRIDGFFGPNTEAATKRFQASVGLTPDGIIGPKTWAMLFPYLSGYTLHRIMAGDTFSGLARRYATTVDAIRIANPMLHPDNLLIGTLVTIPFSFQVTAWNVPYSSLWTGIVLDGLAARYPMLSLDVFGRSSAGRDLYAAHVGTGDIPVGINASHHANEWITTPLVLRMLENLLYAAAYGEKLEGFSATALLARARLTLVPLVNPDGVDLVTGYLEANDPLFQKAMGISGAFPSIPFPSGWKANLNGVDLNLGYPAGWEQAREIKFAQGFTRPAPRDYVGSRPLAEAENRAMAQLTRRESFALTVSYHTQGAEIYWRYGDNEPKNARQIAEAFAVASGYAVQDPARDSSFAGYKDWFIDAFDRPGYTIEAGRGQNPLPLDALPKLYEENIGIFLGALALAQNA